DTTQTYPPTNSPQCRLKFCIPSRLKFCIPNAAPMGKFQGSGGTQGGSIKPRPRSFDRGLALDGGFGLLGGRVKRAARIDLANARSGRGFRAVDRAAAIG